MGNMNKSTIVFSLLLIIVVIALVGPQPQTPTYSTRLPKVNSNLQALSDSIDKAEASNRFVKLNNEARIVWADSLHQQTEWSIVYLHGYTASQMEGDPVHKNIAKKYGMNLYLARLDGHGLASDSALFHMTADGLWETSKKALVIGEKLGKKVILMSTSTGGTLALKLASVYPDKVSALINYSPNVKIKERMAWMLNNPWGITLLNMQSENGYVINSGDEDSVINQYWTTKYRIEALPQLQELIETTMVKEVFKSIKIPSLTIAYYKDRKHQDPTVKVSAMKWMHRKLGTPKNLKKYIKLGSVGVHPLASGLRSKDLEGVERETSIFIEEILAIKN